MTKLKIIFGVMLIVCSSLVMAGEASKKMQDFSVTVKSGRSEGSGVVVTREIDVNGKKEKVNFIFTAAHVIDDLRKTRSIIDKDGDSKTVVEFDEAYVVKELRENGRRVGELKMDCRVIKYSDADHGEDLAILMLLKRDFVQDSAVFLVEKDPEKAFIEVGTSLWHCGSLLGQMGANSLTTGIMSQIGRMHGGKVYDQSTVTAFPGSSGGGVFILKDDQPFYIGMVTRGTGETFNLLVPVRRIHKWAVKSDVEWLINTKITPPTLEEIKEMNIEDEKGGSKVGREYNADSDEVAPANFPVFFLDGEHSDMFGHNRVRKDNIDFMPVLAPNEE